MASISFRETNRINLLHGIVDHSIPIEVEKGEPFGWFSLLLLLIHRRAQLLNEIAGNESSPS
jgi:hypothetical protein